MTFSNDGVPSLRSSELPFVPFRLSGVDSMRVPYSSSSVMSGFAANSRSCADRPYVPLPFNPAEDDVRMAGVGPNVDGGVFPDGFDARSMRGGRSGAGRDCWPPNVLSTEAVSPISSPLKLNLLSMIGRRSCAIE